MTWDDCLAVALALGAPLVAPRALGWLAHRCFGLLGRATQGRHSVKTDADGVAYRGKRLDMAELASVRIVTTAEGPFVPDVFWVLEPRKGAPLVVPQEAPEFDRLLARLQALPEFDNEAILRAMCCTEVGAFICWRMGGVGDGSGPGPT